jgi:hypothetical protein
MFKVKIKSSITKEAKLRLQKSVDEQFISDLQRDVVDNEIKRLITAGVSPVQSVEGGRRFKGYKNPDSYPAKKKAKRPVNLSLSGQMLQWYKAIKVSGVRFALGIPREAPKDVKVRAEANNEGTVNENGQVAIAARRFIPLRGESFNISVMRKIKNLYAQRIKTLLLKK